MSPRRASPPPPLPPLRARPDSPLRFRSGRDRPACSLPPPAPGGGMNTISKPSKPATPAPTFVPTPTPSPASRLPVHAPSLSLGTCPVRLLAAPSRSRRGLLITSIYTFQHNYCVSAPPSSGRFVFSFARSFTWLHASLCYGMGPGERPRKGFSAGAHHKSNS